MYVAVLRGNVEYIPDIHVQYVAFTGKLCLQNADLAKKCVAALARELEISDDPTIRNNIVIILCDLCVRLDIDSFL